MCRLVLHLRLFWRYNGILLFHVAKEGPVINLFWKYRELFLQYKQELLLGALALIVTNGVGVLLPWLAKLCIDVLGNDALSSSEKTAELNSYLLWVLAGSVLLLVVRVYSRMCVLGAGRKIEYDLRNRLYRQLLRLPVTYFSANPTGNLMSRLTNDVGIMRMMVGGGILMAFNTTFAYAASLPFMISISPWLTLLTFILYPCALYAMYRVVRKVKKYSYDVQEVLGDISTIAQENFTGISVIQAYAKEPQEQRRFNRFCGHYFETYKKLIYQRVMLFMLIVVLAGIGLLVSLFEGGREVIIGQMTLGDFVAFTLYLQRLAWPTMAMGWTISIFQQGAAAMQRMDEVLSAQPIRTNQEPDPRQAQPEGKNNDKNDALIRVKDLSFSYVNPYAKQDESQKDKPAEETRRKILSHVSFTVKPGELVAIVGPVGSGKTTLLSLLAGLYDAPRGSVFLAGRDIADWPLDELHQSIALMPQQSFLFSTTLHHNLALARPDASRAETEQLAKNVYLASDIQRFPKQLDTLVGERGVLLSGGQRQRVSLGRTLMKDSEILLLDDPFSNVDAETEENILATLAECQALRQRTTLIATHRFALVQQADKVIMLDAGELVAIGTHEQLMAENPKYQQLVQLETWRRQFEEPVLPQTEEVRP